MPRELRAGHGKSYTQPMVRCIFGCFAILALTLGTSQDFGDLRGRYGQPDVERFTFRPGVTLTVQYGSEGKVSLLSIQPRQAFIHADFEHSPTIPKESVLDILNEVVPMMQRGKLINQVTSEVNCGIVAMDSYENVQISVVYFCTLASVLKAEVRFKAGAEPPQRSADFHTSYGEPDAERFVVGSDLTLAVAVEDGMDGLACRMRIAPRQSLDESSINEQGAPPDEVTQILDQVVPADARGKQLGAGNRIWGSCAGALPPTEYENVTINPYYGSCQRQLVNRGVDVLFKRAACESLPKYSEE